ncbi:MAG: IS5 family transposase [Clostridia bacterium]|nr:IS5 family transposase [Clostridia bacterium]
MYKKQEHQMLLPHDFFLPFGGQLNPDNRWVKMAAMIPWWKVEEKYAKKFKSKTGKVALSVRVALGALIIQNKCNYSDQETVNQITENPYLQYFIGLSEFQFEAPFHSSSMTHFRKRLGKNIINEVNEMIALEATASHEEDEEDNDDSTPNKENSDKKAETAETPKNKGKLLLDATCTPADIHYPTDLGLLNKAREDLESMIDTLHVADVGKRKKPRTYREKARKQYLSVVKQRRPRKKKIRKAIKQQLQYVRRDLGIVKDQIARHGENELSKKQLEKLETIEKLYIQQRTMYRTKQHQVDNRIVSIDQPHVRPIVRGKAQANVEFGAKLSISVVNGYAFMETLGWENYNEGKTLIESVERYKNRFGYYPKAVLVDKIYRNRENLKYCKEKGIRMSGPRLGRPKKCEEYKQKQIAYRDACERNAIEGKFGEGKRVNGLGLIQARLKETSETVIALQLLVMNLQKRLRSLFAQIFLVIFREKMNLLNMLFLKSQPIQ